MIEFTGEPLIEERWWLSKCGRYKISEVLSLRARRFRTWRMIGGKWSHFGFGNDTFGEAIETCNRFEGAKRTGGKRGSNKGKAQRREADDGH